ncbi:MAG: hypothetical protein JOY81_03325, partial [Alphaproteobacteria bacterium]|nr:hypothetical protein [Alphaproteobacteria bacterium]
MAITTTRRQRAERWHTLTALMAAVATVSFLQVAAPSVAQAQPQQVAPKSPVRV